MKKMFYGMFLFLQSAAMAHQGDHGEYVEGPHYDFATLLSAVSRGKLENKVTINNDGDYIYIKTNSIPDHKVSSGRSPNSMEEQDKSYRVAAKPEVNEELTQSNPNSFGVALNGIPFRPSTAEIWNNNRDWVEEAIDRRGKRLLGLDNNYGHVDHSGLYHYHGMPTDLVREQQKKTRQRMALVGYAADGFPIYSQYGHKTALDSKSRLVKLKSSYQLKDGRRPSDGPSGKYDGKYANDYEFVKDSGDLDECNGRFGVTPDFPMGTYYYVITESFPFVSRYWKGTPDDSFLDRRGRGQNNSRQGGENRGNSRDQGDRRQGPPDRNNDEDDRRQGPPSRNNDQNDRRQGPPFNKERPPHPPPHHRFE